MLNEMLTTRYAARDRNVARGIRFSVPRKDEDVREIGRKTERRSVRSELAVRRTEASGQRKSRCPEGFQVAVNSKGEGRLLSFSSVSLAERSGAEPRGS